MRSQHYKGEIHNYDVSVRGVKALLAMNPVASAPDPMVFDDLNDTDLAEAKKVSKAVAEVIKKYPTRYIQIWFWKRMVCYPKMRY